jgi:hypothetical protein
MRTLFGAPPLSSVKPLAFQEYLPELCMDTYIGVHIGLQCLSKLAKEIQRKQSWRLQMSELRRKYRFMQAEFRQSGM